MSSDSIHRRSVEPAAAATPAADSSSIASSGETAGVLGGASTDVGKKKDAVGSASLVDGAEKGPVVVQADDYDASQGISEKTKAKFKQLGWVRLTVCLIVEAIALGALSLPGVFATLGLVPGALTCIGIGLIAIYTSYLVGRACNRSPIPIEHFHDLGELMFGRVGREVIGGCFFVYLGLVTGSHALTGAIAFNNLSNSAVCSIVFTVVSSIILFLVALPPSFADIAILGYIDFVSICAAILLTIVATGIQASNAPGGLSAVNWHAFPEERPTFAKAFVAITNVVFAYSFAICQPSFQAELKKPNDYIKSVWALGITEIVLYTLTGAIIYVFVGQGVQSPALLSAGPTVSKIAFGIALPVIFISGSINTTSAARYMHVRIFGKTRHRWISTPLGIGAWLGLNAVIVIFGWVVASLVPFFENFLGLMASLAVSGFTFYLPALMWFLCPGMKEGTWRDSWKNIMLAAVNAVIFLMGIFILVCGVYSSVTEIKEQYATGTIHRPFSCNLH
ncbi:hypothetical protein K437DRAFT_54422 [Tilletiaria anomala UBC 951]|uniref:Amino acid transporter transmembrane domain-containing protein n=1 Tax=Tilletiaria anomala (strain ATCC 24038 / CBS 436.72 / UBC 951) TaxID=1037660 RepID=A0A066VD31_TILAU|nr:uncharacterized protein K437DRAFT_54422 [Tilletiaria anomala UBC 951]KDN36490.1 hypothetical protein K437DRAFT_54422 [Tilletiaria anomala UBC 951]